MNAPDPAIPEAPSPFRIAVDGAGLVACLEVLGAATRPVTEVATTVDRRPGQSGHDVWLDFVTHHPTLGWERNGIAAKSAGIDAGRRIVVDVRDLVVAARGHLAASPTRSCVLEWHDDRLVIDGRTMPALDAFVPAVPDVVTMRDAVYLASRGVGDVTVESEQGRIWIPHSLVSHLHERGAHVAAFGAVDGALFVVAQSELQGRDSTAPVIVAPVSVLMHSEEVTPAEFHERRRRGGSEVEQLLAALDPATPVPVLLELLDGGIAYVRRRVAAHPSLPNVVTDELASTGTLPMRVAVAGNPSLGPVAVEVLLSDPDALVRAALATNPALAPEGLVRLAYDRDADVRAATVAHPALPADVRVGLAVDEAAGVRVAVAADRAADPEIVRRLTADADPDVRRAAAANPACPVDALEPLIDLMPHAVLANPVAPEHLLVDGARSVDGGLRAIVAANLGTPARVLTTLSRDPDARVLRAVASNPRTPDPARRRAEKRVATDNESIVASASPRV